MSIAQRAIFLTSLLAASCPALAVRVESTTSIMLTMRECIAGENVCETVGPPTTMILGGLPGENEARKTHEDPAFGEVSGDVKLTALPRVSEHSARSRSLPGACNGGNAAMFRKYTNNSSDAEIVTLAGHLTYEQSVPDENAGLPENSSGRSGAGIELEIGRINADAVEAGTTAEDNYRMLDQGLDELEYSPLAFEIGGPLSNVSESGTRTISVTVTVEAGESIWLWAALQCLSANGAEVSASFVTELETRSVQ